MLAGSCAVAMTVLAVANKNFDISHTIVHQTVIVAISSFGSNRRNKAIAQVRQCARLPHQRGFGSIGTALSQHFSFAFRLDVRKGRP